MKKIMLIVIGLFVLCGCSANATINIDENENVSENIYLYVTNDVIELNDMTKEEFIDLRTKYIEMLDNKLIKFHLMNPKKFLKII